MSKVHQALQKAAKHDRPIKTAIEENFLEDLEKDFIHSFNRNRVDTEDPQLGSKEFCPSSHPPGERAGLPGSVDPKLVPISAPKSFAGERYQALKTKLFQIRNTNGLKTILITSALPLEGKTLTAVNLALTISREIEQKVLLVDADLRKPSIHRVLGLATEKGLADCLGENSPAGEIVFKTKFAHLYVVSAGNIPEKPTELLNTQRMREFLSSAAEQFDWVILDSPPLSLADAELLSSLVDGILIVVRACQTPEHVVVKAMQTLKDKRILGFVFNGTKDSNRSGYDYPKT